MKRSLRLWLSGALVFAASAASAHRGHDSFTVVTIAADGRVVVSHRFEAHDLEPALSVIAPDAQPNLDDPAAIAALQSYVARRFSLVVTGRAIPLAAQGTTIEGQDVRITLGGKLPKGARVLQVRSSLLTDVYPRQQHQVNVRRGQSVRTLRFSGGGSQTVALR